jgi:putative two-component system response regulator
MLKRVLIVDDNLTNLTQLAVLLERKYEVVLAKSGAMALRVCEKELPDLILLDVEMPEMNGFETMAHLKADDRCAQIPVIFLTGNTDYQTELSALESGAVDFVSKPPNPKVLMHRIQLHIDLSQYRNSLQSTATEIENSIVVSFADLIECKDENVGGHVLRTSKDVEVLGKGLLKTGIFGEELTLEYLKRTVMATPFHDIGKVGVSDIILSKSEKLTDEEYEAAKQHTHIGTRAMNNIYRRNPDLKYLELAAQIALSHHERWDGKGYPDGLLGDAIPLCARMVAIVNVFDACLTDKIYRPALSMDETLQVVEKGRGLIFDPRVTDAFFETYKDFELPDVQISEGVL